MSALYIPSLWVHLVRGLQDELRSDHFVLLRLRVEAFGDPPEGVHPDGVIVARQLHHALHDQLSLWTNNILKLFFAANDDLLNPNVGTNLDALASHSRDY